MKINLSQKDIEEKWQKKWIKDKVFETKKNNQEKYFGTVAYPYANSSLHIGHGKTYITNDILLRFQRLLGKNVLYPMGFHISGTPVLAVCDEVKRGNKKKILELKKSVEIFIKDKKKIESIVSSFENPENIANFFSSKIEETFNCVGLSCDWSRKFTTGEEIYNSFIEWQYKKLKDLNILIQDDYPILYSVQDENAVGEDDIKDGDTNKVTISQMTLIKFKINNFNKLDAYDENQKFISNKFYLDEIKNKNLFFKAAHILLIDKNNNLIFQKSSNKVFSPNKFKFSAGGIVKKNSNYLETVFEELQEELKIKISIKDIEKTSKSFYMMEKDTNFNSNIYKFFYFLKVDCDLSNYQIKNSEVEELKIFKSEELKKELKNENHNFIKNFHNEIFLKKFFQYIEDLKYEKGVKINFIKKDLSDNLEEEFICCATLRPDALFCSTNLWVDEKMKLSKLKVGDEIWYVSKSAQKKIENQFENVKFISNLNGKILLDKKVFTPILNKTIPIYNANFLDENQGTGIAYSSPADSVHDYLYLFEKLFPNKKLIEFKDSEPLNLTPITKTFDKKNQLIKYKFDIPSYSKLFEHKVFTTKNNEDKLEKIKKEMYKEAHFGAIMINCGEEFNKTPLKNNVGSNKVLEKLKKLNLGNIFLETSRRAKTRGGDDVIVANLEGQWFLDYSNLKDKEKALNLLKNLNYVPEYLKETQKTYLNWVSKRPCARKRGLGTKLPYDKNWIIEPLSDSTIYQIFYSIAAIIRRENLTHKNLIFDFYDYLFLGLKNLDEVSKKSKISKKVLEELKDEANYWGGGDIRFVGQPHMSNHLTFLIYHYALIFSSEKLSKFHPKNILVGGMLKVNGEKMSKSKGNILPLIETTKKVGADIFRLYIAVQSNLDIEMDFKFDEVKKLEKNFDKLKSIILQSLDFEKQKFSNFDFIDKWLISKFYFRCQFFFEEMKKFNIRDAYIEIFYEFLKDISYHTRRCNLSKTLKVIRFFIEDYIKILTPVTPHICEEFYEILNKKKNIYISLSSFSTKIEDFINLEIIKEEEIIQELLLLIGREISNQNKNFSKLYLIQASNLRFKIFYEIQNEINKKNSPKEIMPNLFKKFENDKKFLQKFVPKTFQSGLHFFMSKEEERKKLESVSNFLKKEFKLKEIIILSDKVVEKESSASMPSRVQIKLE